MARRSANKSKRRTTPSRPSTAADLRAPNMPVDVFIGEAQGTLAGARLHAARLATIGFPERWMRQAEEGLALLVEAQTNWLATRRRGREAAESVVLARATALRRELLATAAYALRHNGPARQKVAAIRKGVSLYDLAQDLKNIAALIKHNAPAFEEVRFDFARCAEARATSDELLKAHAASVTRGTRGDAKERRNRAFTATATVLAEIRAAGLYVLRNENRPDWLAMFRSRHEVQRGQRDRARGKKRPQASDLALRSAPAPKPEA